MFVGVDIRGKLCDPAGSDRAETALSRNHSRPGPRAHVLFAGGAAGRARGSYLGPTWRPFLAGSPAPGRGNSAARGGFRVQRAVARVHATGLRWGPSASSSWRRGLSFEVSLSVWGRQRTFLRHCARPWPDFPRCAAQVWWRAIARTTFAGVQRERVCVPPPPPPLHTHTHTLC